MPKGVVRKVDSLGRISPPKEMRRALGIGEHDQVDMYMEDGRIVIEPLRWRCARCGCGEEVRQADLAGVSLCRVCAGVIRASVLGGK